MKIQKNHRLHTLLYASIIQQNPYIKEILIKLEKIHFWPSEDSQTLLLFSHGITSFSFLWWFSTFTNERFINKSKRSSQVKEWIRSKISFMELEETRSERCWGWAL